MPYSDPAKINILIVDDVQSNIITLEAILKSPEYNFVSTTSAKEAFKLCDQYQFAVALIDVQMPVVNGFELARMIRSKIKKPLPIIFVTATQHSEDLISQGYQLGAVDFLYKPLNVEALKSKVSFFAELARSQWREQKSQEDQLETVVHNMSEGLVISDPQGNMIFWNPAALAIHGFKSVNEVSKNLEEAPGGFRISSLEGRVLPLEEWPMSRVLRGESIKEVELMVERTDIGHKIIASYSGSAVLDSEKKISLGILSLRDVSFKFQAEKEMKQAIRIRDEFISIATHELNTPLTSLKLQLQMFERRLVKNDLNPEILRKISSVSNKQVDRTLRLVEDMLDVSRISAGSLKLNITDCDLKIMIEDVYNGFEGLYKERNIPLILKLDEDVTVKCDCSRLEQVVSNLVSNALKYGNNRPVAISLTKADDKAIISVKDQGLGIAPEHIESIFNRFERVTQNKSIGGLGLGLFISRQILKLHNGKIEVESSLGKGSEFKVMLPLLSKGIYEQ